MTMLPEKHTRKDQADATRARLLDLAWLMALRNGIHELTVRKLALKAGVATGLPYAYFKTRDELIDALRLRAWDELDRLAAQSLLAIQQQGGHFSAEAAIRAGMHAIVDFSLRQPNFFDLISMTPGQRVSDRVLGREILTAQRMVMMLQEGAGSKEFSFHGDVIVFALALWTSIQGHISRMSAYTNEIYRPYQAAVLDEILESFFARVRAAGFKPKPHGRGHSHEQPA